MTAGGDDFVAAFQRYYGRHTAMKEYRRNLESAVAEDFAR
jgi:hypothetical protein